MKKCVICGREFKPKSKNHKTCSPECSKENRRKRCLVLANEYYQKNRQHCLECSHNYYTTNKKKISRYKAEWYQLRKAELKKNENH